MIKNCDMCGTLIKDGRCDCGTWVSKEEVEENPFKAALEEFDSMKKFIVTMDAPNLGCAAIFFRGDYLNCKEVEDFIYKLKGRPNYE